MNFDDYQKLSRRTAAYPSLLLAKAHEAESSPFNLRFLYPALGLGGEAGEVLENVKRIIRDDNGVVTDERRSKIEKELGDVLWYVAQLATEFSLSLGKIATANLEKLSIRLEQNKLHGEGDER